MNTIVERFLIPLFFVMSILYVFNSLCDERIELKKVFHHVSDDDSYIEKGTLAFYFSKAPQVKELIQTTQGAKKSRSFFFPDVVIATPECQSMIDRINKAKVGYVVSIQKTEIPEKGVVITFIALADSLAIEYDIFDSIGLQKGIAFRIYNKDVLSRLHNNNQPLLRTLWHTGKPCVAIDPGHGGIDSGAVSVAGIQEKDVSLAISTLVADLLEKNGCLVVLTRNKDEDVFLDQRTAYANNNHADLLVSIHANFSPNNRSHGIETFCLKPSLCTRISSYLSEEDKKNVHIMAKAVDDFSYKAARLIQNNICAFAKQKHTDVIDRKVKHAVAQVLLGTRMPSVLVEVGFLSHHKESELLNDTGYQAVLAHGIVKGIMEALSLHSVI